MLRSDPSPVPAVGGAGVDKGFFVLFVPSLCVLHAEASPRNLCAIQARGVYVVM